MLDSSDSGPGTTSSSGGPSSTMLDSSDSGPGTTSSSGGPAAPC